MEITRHTFNEELDSIIKAINDSTFLAIDGEFTGLDATDAGHAAPFDTPAERYHKIKNGCSDFLLIHFGLCAFKVDEENQKYEARPYNFYVFPRPHSRNAPDRRFLCQSSSIDFLIAQGFDFNKLFKEGIPYLTSDQESKLKAELDRKHEEINKLASPGITSPDGGSARKAPVPVPEEQKPFLENICDKITQYLESEEETEPLTIPPCNGFQRKLIYQTVEEKFPLVHLSTKTGEKKERFLVVTKAKDAEELHKRELEKQNLEKMELDIQVGFSKVIKAITESGKLVVGHNMFLDVIHAINQFCCRLPESVDDFKTVVKSVFPRLLDTKLMASTAPFQEHMLHTSLKEVKLTLQNPPFTQAKVETAEGFSRYDDGGGAMHEAGYDAFLTGCCFATMTKYLGNFQKPPQSFLLPTSPVVEPFVNKLFLMRINDIPYLNLNGPDMEVQRDHVFHVTFPKEWKPSDLFSLFHPYGNIQISWLTDTTAYVALHNKDNAKTALKILTTQDAGTYHVMSYANHHRSKSLRWHAATSASHSPTTQLTKRKMSPTDIEHPPAKVKRHSLSNESPSCPVIPEEDEQMEANNEDNDGGDGKERDNNKNNHHVSSSSGSAAEQGKDGAEGAKSKSKSKLFEESEEW